MGPKEACACLSKLRGTRARLRWGRGEQRRRDGRCREQGRWSSGFGTAAAHQDAGVPFLARWVLFESYLFCMENRLTFYLWGGRRQPEPAFAEAHLVPERPRARPARPRSLLDAQRRADRCGLPARRSTPPPGKEGGAARAPPWAAVGTSRVSERKPGAEGPGACDSICTGRAEQAHPRRREAGGREAGGRSPEVRGRGAAATASWERGFLQGR